MIPEKGGMFEISYWESEQNSTRPNIKIYSKLETKKFPDEEQILQTIERLLAGTSVTEGKPVETEGKGTQL